MTSPRRRNSGGYSILELLVVVALFGLVTMTVGGILPSVWRQARAAFDDEGRFERRWQAVVRLRADVERAERIENVPAGFRLASSGRTITWQVESSRLVRRLEIPAGSVSPAASASRIERVFELSPAKGGAVSELAVERIGGKALARWKFETGRVALHGWALVGGELAEVSR